MVKQNLGHDVYKAWADGSQESGQNRSNGNVFFDKHIIYSYGHHFEMAHRIGVSEYIVNADTYSSTTSGHQSAMRFAIMGRKQIQIPFSILRGPRINISEIEIVDTEPDRQIYKGERKQEDYALVDGRYVKTGQHMEPQYLHLMGRSVLRVNRVVERWTSETCPGRPCSDGCDHMNWEYDYFLSGTDETMRDPWRSYFLAQLPCKVDTVGQAIEALKPDAVGHAEDAGLDVKRQGEWFFIPTNGPLRGATYAVGVDYGMQRLPIKYLAHINPDRQRRHICTHLKVKDGMRYAKGTVRHTGGEHKMLNLGKVWHTVHENTEVRSYRGAGRID